MVRKAILNEPKRLRIRVVFGIRELLLRFGYFWAPKVTKRTISPLNTPKSNIIFLKLFNKLNTETMNRYIGFLALALTTSLFSSCSLIEGIFKAGMWWGIILVIGAVILVIWLISKLFGGRGGTN